MRCFEDDNVIHVSNRVDPVEDSAVINFELALADVGQIERRIDRLGKKTRLKEEVMAQDVSGPLVFSADHELCTESLEDAVRAGGLRGLGMSLLK